MCLQPLLDRRRRHELPVGDEDLANVAQLQGTSALGDERDRAAQRRAFSEKNRHTVSLAEKLWLCGPFAGQSTTSALDSPPGQL